MRRWLLAAVLAAATSATAADIPSHLSQGGIVVARVAQGSKVSVAGKPVRVGADGTVVFGAGRDQTSPLQVTVTTPAGVVRRIAIVVDPRDWPIERVNGVPPSTVNPDPALAARIAREQAEVTAVRERDDDRKDFAHGFIWPVTGRVSGRFGNQRIYNGDPKAPHSGMDIAVPTGTPVKAPAAGIITFAKPGLYLTGGTVVLDHGYGLSSNFLHLSRIDVTPGQHIAQGQVIGAAGMTGRATGPHVHWGFNWFGVRLDPLLLPGIDKP